MNPKTQQSLCRRLGRIRDHYISLRAVSSRFLDGSAIDDANAVLQERAAILAEIEREEIGISAVLDGPDAAETYRLRQEIASLIRAQFDSDKLVMAKVKDRMNALRREMTGLYTSKGAARAYTVQSRIPG